MVNFGPLAAEIVSLVWGIPGNFNVFSVLAALLHGTLVVGVSQTGALNRGRHLYSAGRPSRWALAHISSCSLFYLMQNDNTHTVGRLLFCRAAMFIPFCSIFMFINSTWCYFVTWSLITVALWNRADHYIFIMFLSFFFLLFFSLNHSGRRLDVYHTSTHGVVLVWI